MNFINTLFQAMFVIQTNNKKLHCEHNFSICWPNFEDTEIEHIELTSSYQWCEIIDGLGFDHMNIIPAEELPVFDDAGDFIHGKKDCMDQNSFTC